MGWNSLRLKDITLSLPTNQLTAGDVAAATQEITNALRDIGQGAILRSLMVIDEDDQGAALEILFFGADVDIGAEEAAPDLADADVRHFLGKVTVGTADYYDVVGNRVAHKDDLNFVLSNISGSSIYVAVVNGAGTPTYSAAGLTLRLGIEYP